MTVGSPTDSYGCTAGGDAPLVAVPRKEPKAERTTGLVLVKFSSSKEFMSRILFKEDGMCLEKGSAYVLFSAASVDATSVSSLSG